MLATGTVSVAAADNSTPNTAALSRLSSTQQQCLVGQAITFLDEHGGQPIDASLVPTLRQGIQSAAQACGVTMPRAPLRRIAGRLGLTASQVQCVLAKGLTLPGLNTGQLPSRAQLQPLLQQALAAAQACGITVPPRLAPAAQI